MKTQEEIDQLASEHILSENGQLGFVLGYIQCQKDMVAKKYTEEDLINLMFMATKWNTFKDGDVEHEMNMSDFFKYLINSLNKQDKWNKQQYNGYK